MRGTQSLYVLTVRYLRLPILGDLFIITQFMSNVDPSSTAGDTKRYSTKTVPLALGVLSFGGPESTENNFTNPYKYTIHKAAEIVMLVITCR